MAEPDRLTRRRFLAGAAAAAVAPYVVPATARGRAAGVAPSERVVVGCIGVGNQGHAVMRNFLAQDAARVVAVCDVKTRARDIARDRVDGHYGGRGCATYHDFHDLLARPDLDAVLVATPDHWHVLAATAAARTGRDVYLEKPIGLAVAQAQVLRATLRRYGRVFQFGTQQRSDWRFRRACELVRNGRIGRLHTINVWSPTSRPGGSLQVVPPPAYLDYDRWLGPAPFVPHTLHRCANSIIPGEPYKIWPFISDYCTGWISGWGVHPLDIALWGGGPELGPPVEVRGRGVFPAEGACDTAVGWDVTVRFAGGVVLNFTGEPAPPAWRQRYGRTEAHGTAFEGAEGWVHVNRSGLDASPRGLLDSAVGPDEVRLYESRSHEGNFVDCVRSRAQTISPIDEAVAVDTLCQLSAIAVDLARPLRWDHRAERFVDDAEADRRLARAMRGPWHL